MHIHFVIARKTFKIFKQRESRSGGPKWSFLRRHTCGLLQNVQSWLISSGFVPFQTCGRSDRADLFQQEAVNSGLNVSPSEMLSLSWWDFNPPPVFFCLPSSGRPDQRAGAPLPDRDQCQRCAAEGLSQRALLWWEPTSVPSDWSVACQVRDCLKKNSCSRRLSLGSGLPTLHDSAGFALQADDPHQR